MKKIISVALATLLVLSAVMTFPVVFANTTANDIITNTFDDGWTPNDANLSLETSEVNNGNALKLNKATSSTATPTGNSVRHYKIYDPEKVSGEFVDYKPTANTTYKITFRYYTTSLAGNSIFVNVRGVENDTVGDILTRAVTVKKWLKLYEADGETKLYVWEDAVAYFTTPETDLDALAISVEWNGANDSTGVNVTIDNVKLEKFSENYVLFNAFEEDNVTETTLNIGTNTLNYKNNSYNTFTTGYNTNSAGSANANTLRANGTLGFRAARYAGDSANEIVRYEIYDYSKGLGTDGKLHSFIPEKGSTYKVSFQYKVKASGTTNLLFNIRPVTVDGEGNRTLGEAIANLVIVPKSDANHSTAKWHSPDAVEFTITDDFDGLALTVETASGTPKTYTFIDNVLLTEVKEECTHENTTTTNTATYFKDGMVTVVCDDCGETVSETKADATNIALDEANCKEEFANDKLTITLAYSEDLLKDIYKENGAVIYFNYSINGYTKTDLEIPQGNVAKVTLEGFNVDRLNAELTYYLTAKYDGVDTTKLAEDTTNSLKVSEKIDANSEIGVLMNALKTEANTVVSTKIDATTHFAENTITADLKEGTMVLNFIASDELVAKLGENSGLARTNKITVTIDGVENEYTFTQIVMRKSTTIKISGMSFEQLYGKVTIKVEFIYEADTEKNISDTIVFEGSAAVEATDSDVATAFKSYIAK